MAESRTGLVGASVCFEINTRLLSLPQLPRLARRRAGERIYINFARDRHWTLRWAVVVARRAPVGRVALRHDDAADVLRVKEYLDVVQFHEVRVLWRRLILAIVPEIPRVLFLAPREIMIVRHHDSSSKSCSIKSASFRR